MHIDKMKRIRFWIPAILWMSLIFWFSAQPAEISGEMSMNTGMLIGRILVPGFEEKTEKEQAEYAEKIEYAVRKTAHASEYAILGILVFAAFYFQGSRFRVRKLAGLSFLVSASYAATDELHQFFVPGRACRLLDVCIDSAGALAGIVLCSGVVWVLHRHNNR